MRQHPRVEPPNPLSPAIALHPVLSDALAHLDIQLEEELVRYRRQRTGTGRTTHQPGRKRSSESLDLIAVSATASGYGTAAAQPVPALEERLANVTEQATTPDAYKPIPAFTANPQPFDGAIALRTPTETLTQDGNSSSMLSGSDESYALAQPTNPNLDDYLESSEELLRSLADEQAEVQAERSFMQSLLTPLGLGAMLLLLLSSAMFGYVIMNPSSLPWLTAKEPQGGGSSPEQNVGQRPSAPPQPDLSSRELQQLNLNNLGTLNAGPGPTSSTAPGRQSAATPNSKPPAATTKVSPVTSQPDSEPDATAPAPAVTSSSSRPYARTTAMPQAAPSSPVSIPQAALRSAPAPAPVAPLPRTPRPTDPDATTASQSNGGSSTSYQYKVGIPFENDQTLENARKVVPDAFVRTLPNGKTIVQGGAAKNEAEAKAMTQRLRDQGLSAEVYKR